MERERQGQMLRRGPKLTGVGVRYLTPGVMVDIAKTVVAQVNAGVEVCSSLLRPIIKGIIQGRGQVCCF